MGDIPNRFCRPVACCNPFNWSFPRKTIFDVVQQPRQRSQVPALRAIVHSPMAKCIGAIRQDIREQEPNNATSSWTENSHRVAVDQRNERGNGTKRSVEEIARAMGFSETMPALRQASIPPRCVLTGPMSGSTRHHQQMGCTADDRQHAQVRDRTRSAAGQGTGPRLWLMPPRPTRATIPHTARTARDARQRAEKAMRDQVPTFNSFRRERLRKQH